MCHLLSVGGWRSLGSPGADGVAAALLRSELTPVGQCTAGLLLPGPHAGGRQYGVSSRSQRWGCNLSERSSRRGDSITPKPTSRLGFTRGPHQNLWNHVPGPIGQLKDTRGEPYARKPESQAGKRASSEEDRSEGGSGSTL